MDAAMEALVDEYLGLAHSLAQQVWRTAPHALELDEMRSIANLGLVQCAARWYTFCERNGHDPAALQFFKPFVVRRVYGALIDAIRSADWATRSLRTRAKALQEAGQDRGLKDLELAAKTGMTVAEVRSTIQGMAQRPLSLEAEELDPQARHGDVESAAFTRHLLDEVAAVIEGLAGEQRVVLVLRYFENQQLQQVAQTMGIPESYVSQLHADGVLAVHHVMLAAAQAREGSQVKLTPVEKAAGRWFRDEAQAGLDAANASHPPTYLVPSVIGVYRHSCVNRDNISTAIELAELYATSPAIAVRELSAEEPDVLVAREHTDEAGDGWEIVPAGRFGFIHRFGVCRRCGSSARSGQGRWVDATQRAPITGRVAR